MADAYLYAVGQATVDLRLKDFDVRYLAWLSTHTGGRSWWSALETARTLNVSEWTVYRSLPRLEKAGYVDVIRRHGRSPLIQVLAQAPLRNRRAKVPPQSRATPGTSAKGCGEPLANGANEPLANGANEPLAAVPSKGGEPEGNHVEGNHAGAAFAHERVGHGPSVARPRVRPAPSGPLLAAADHPNLDLAHRAFEHVRGTVTKYAPGRVLDDLYAPDKHDNEQARDALEAIEASEPGTVVLAAFLVAQDEEWLRKGKRTHRLAWLKTLGRLLEEHPVCAVDRGDDWRDALDGDMLELLERRDRYLASLNGSRRPELEAGV